MKILLTGASGYIGQALLKELGPEGAIKLFGRRLIEGDHEFVKGDILKYEDLLKAVDDVDTIIHLAAFAPEVKERGKNEDFFNNNVNGTFNVLEAALNAKVKRVVFASSVCAVGYENQELPVKETAPPRPSDGMYGLSKYLAEQLCMHYAKWYGISTICLRMATVVPQNKIIVPPDPIPPFWFGYVDIRDVVQAFKLSIDRSDIRHGVFHICAQNAHSRYDIFLAKTKLGYNPVYNYDEYITGQRKERLTKKPLNFLMLKLAPWAGRFKRKFKGKCN